MKLCVYEKHNGEDDRHAESTGDSSELMSKPTARCCAGARLAGRENKSPAGGKSKKKTSQDQLKEIQSANPSSKGNCSQLMSRSAPGCRADAKLADRDCTFPAISKS